MNTLNGFVIRDPEPTTTETESGNSDVDISN